MKVKHCNSKVSIFCLETLNYWIGGHRLQNRKLKNTKNTKATNQFSFENKRKTFAHFLARSAIVCKCFPLILNQTPVGCFCFLVFFLLFFALMFSSLVFSFVSACPYLFFSLSLSRSLFLSFSLPVSRSLSHSLSPSINTLQPRLGL